MYEDRHVAGVVRLGHADAFKVVEHTGGQEDIRLPERFSDAEVVAGKVVEAALPPVDGEELDPQLAKQSLVPGHEVGRPQDVVDIGIPAGDRVDPRIRREQRGIGLTGCEASSGVVCSGESRELTALGVDGGASAVYL